MKSLSFDVCGNEHFGAAIYVRGTEVAGCCSSVEPGGPRMPACRTLLNRLNRWARWTRRTSNARWTRWTRCARSSIQTRHARWTRWRRRTRWRNLTSLTSWTGTVATVHAYNAHDDRTSPVNNSLENAGTADSAGRPSGPGGLGRPHGIVCRTLLARCTRWTR